jgi:hypothetical protein
MNRRLKRKPLKFTARERKFCTYACESLGVIMIGLTVFAFQAQNLLVAQVWFLAGVLSIFLGVHVERRFGVQRKQTMGVLTPILLVGIFVTAFAAIYLSGPSLISPRKHALAGAPGPAEGETARPRPPAQQGGLVVFLGQRSLRAKDLKCPTTMEVRSVLDAFSRAPPLVDPLDIEAPVAEAEGGQLFFPDQHINGRGVNAQIGRDLRDSHRHRASGHRIWLCHGPPLLSSCSLGQRQSQIDPRAAASARPISRQFQVSILESFQLSILECCQIARDNAQLLYRFTPARHHA